MPDGSEITAAVIEAAKARDARLRLVDRGDRLRDFLNNSPAQRVLMEVAAAAAHDALEALITVNPADTWEIIRLQAIVFRHRFAYNSWAKFLEAAKEAEAAINLESKDAKSIDIAEAPIMTEEPNAF